MVTASANNNKFYRQIPHGDGWTAEYGRVGSTAQRLEYPFSQWESKYREKLKKGYVDQSDLAEDLIAVETPEPESRFKAIHNKSIEDIVNRLQNMAKKAIAENYTVSSNNVTQAMVDEAQSIIDSLLGIEQLSEFNEALIKLFVTIPRAMGNVRQFLPKSTDDFPRIIQKEQDLLDVMRGQAVHRSDFSNNNDTPTEYNCTILEHLGLEFEECDHSDIARIKAALGSCADKYYCAWKVTNQKTQERFDKFVRDNNIRDVRLLFHGSRNENWWSIINSGLVLRPTNAIITGKMFGSGIYYAPKAQKSLGYTSLHGSYWANGNAPSGFMALMNVAYGKQYDAYSFDYRFRSLDYDGLQRICPGANCLHAHAGRMLRNDEIVIYKEEQCTIKYLVELRN